MFYLYFWRTSFSKHWSVDADEKDIGSLWSTHRSNVIFLLCGLETFNCLLEKYYIRLPKIFVISGVNFGCAYVGSDLLKVFIFWIFTSSFVYTCKYIPRISIHQLFVSPSFGSSKAAPLKSQSLYFCLKGDIKLKKNENVIKIFKTKYESILKEIFKIFTRVKYMFTKIDDSSAQKTATSENL